MFEKVVEILMEHVEADSITPESTLIGDLGLSSLDVVNVVVAFEDTFDIEIPDRIIPELITVADIVNYLEQHV